MSAPSILWQGRSLPFRPGQTLAAIFAANGITSFGKDELGNELRLFCGSGLCQCCLVRAEGRVVEACITPAMDGMRVAPLTSEICEGAGHD